MSLASVFAADIAAEQAVMSSVEATAPTGWSGPNMTATVNRDGSCQLVAAGQTYNIPAAVMLAFSAWVDTTFG